jgi:hypothetical protein
VDGEARTAKWAESGVVTAMKKRTKKPKKPDALAELIKQCDRLIAHRGFQWCECGDRVCRTVKFKNAVAKARASR